MYIYIICIAVYIYSKYICIHIYIYEQWTKLYVKFDAMHKLGSSPIGCEDFRIPGCITNGVSI